MMSHLNVDKKKKKFLLHLEKEKNKTIIIITHDTEILKHTDYILEVKTKKLFKKLELNTNCYILFN